VVKRALAALTIAGIAAFSSTGASADDFAPCEPEDVQCHQNCSPRLVLDEGIKNIRIEYVWC
jgi:hypothetical protein